MSCKTRKSIVMQRLRRRLTLKSEPLADQFEFRVYVAFVFKDSKKLPILYRATDIVPVMTSNYESTIMKAAEESMFSIDNGKNLLDKDTVQLHASTYHHLHEGVSTSVPSMNFLLWPRKDIDHITCAVFSRWKDDPGATFQHIQQEFRIYAQDYEWQIMQTSHQQSSEMMVYNADNSVFLLVQNNHASEKRPHHCTLSSLCLFLPQSKLLLWDTTTEDDIVRSFAKYT
ncbi:uncharacterized protein C6orf62 homolog [Clavelina lepadiformis]|uniref:Uncharacterized protein n=1 Tax=Clavelina lepadiformis TaxID=159417 RepID=A0ABP0H4A2_CLALP